MKKAATGDTVQVECRVDSVSAPEKAPREKFRLEFTIGENRLIPGLEKAVIGMAAGETKIERIAVREAFGDPKPELVMPIPIDKVPDDLEPTVGQRIDVMYSDGKARPATVKEVRDEEVVVDVNHPLAGEDLVLEITLVAIAA